MKCYYSSNEDAVGICKSCGRGLSRDYAVDLGRGLACRDRCEEDVRTLIRLIDNSARAGARSTEFIRRNALSLYGTAAFTLAMGAFILGFGVYRNFELFGTGLGTLFIIFGAFLYLRARRMAQIYPEKMPGQPPVLDPGERKTHSP